MIFENLESYKPVWQGLEGRSREDEEDSLGLRAQ
jgi:hypothetical protein